MSGKLCLVILVEKPYIDWKTILVENPTKSLASRAIVNESFLIVITCFAVVFFNT